MYIEYSAYKMNMLIPLTPQILPERIIKVEGDILTSLKGEEFEEVLNMLFKNINEKEENKLPENASNTSSRETEPEKDYADTEVLNISSMPSVSEYKDKSIAEEIPPEEFLKTVKEDLIQDTAPARHKARIEIFLRDFALSSEKEKLLSKERPSKEFLYYNVKKGELEGENSRQKIFFITPEQNSVSLSLAPEKSTTLSRTILLIHEYVEDHKTLKQNTPKDPESFKVKNTFNKGVDHLLNHRDILPEKTVLPSQEYEEISDPLKQEKELPIKESSLLSKKGGFKKDFEAGFFDIKSPNNNPDTHFIEVEIASETHQIHNVKQPVLKMDNDSSSIEVLLEHDELGRLNIRLTHHNGVIEGRINVFDTAAKDFMERNLYQIISMLVKEGINIGNFSLVLKERNGNDMEELKEYQKGGKNLKKLQEPIRNSRNGVISIIV
jgi:hypothetical protein